MREKRDILNNKFYIITLYINNFFITNLWFLIVISPVLIYLYKFKVNISILLFISVLIGPAITTLFSVMGKLIREGEIAPTKDFFHFYKLNFFQGLLIGAILNTVISIICYDIKYFSSKGNTYMLCLFISLLVLILMLSLYIYPIISRYNIKVGYLFQLSIKLLVKKIYISLSCMSIIIIVLGSLRIAKLSLIGVLFGISIICYLLARVEKSTLDGLEEEIKEKYKSI